MSTFTTRYEQHEKLRELAAAYRAKDWSAVLRYLLEENGVRLCGHGYAFESECPQCESFRAAGTFT